MVCCSHGNVWCVVVMVTYGVMFSGPRPAAPARGTKPGALRSTLMVAMVMM